MGLILDTNVFHAATAIAHNCAVLTDNIREFGRVPGLETIPLPQPEFSE